MIVAQEPAAHVQGFEQERFGLFETSRSNKMGAQDIEALGDTTVLSQRSASHFQCGPVNCLLVFVALWPDVITVHPMQALGHIGVLSSKQSHAHAVGSPKKRVALFEPALLVPEDSQVVQ